MGAVADDRQCLLGQRGEDQLAVLAVAEDLGVIEGVNDLRAEVVLPDVVAVLGFV